MRRVVVIGTSGAGKTSFAEALAAHLSLPHVEIDALFWGPDWTPRNDFAEALGHAIDGDEWVADGNYAQHHERIWPRADTIIWLDYPLPTILRRLAARTLRRCVRREPLWADNRERWRTQLFTRDSVFRWCVSSFFRHRREYPDLLLRAARRGTYVVRFRTPRRALRWLNDLREISAV